MLKLLAIDVHQGWAFVEQDGHIALIRSPYRDQDKRPTSQHILARAVQDRDFEPCDREFSGWSELIHFIKEAVVSHAKQQGHSLDQDVGDELITVAPPALIETLLDQVEQELLPTGELVTAQKVLESIRDHSPVMNTSPELRERVRKLSLTIKAKQKEAQERREQMLEDYTGYERLRRSDELEQSRRFGKLIQGQGAIFK